MTLEDFLGVADQCQQNLLRLHSYLLRLVIHKEDQLVLKLIFDRRVSELFLSLVIILLETDESHRCPDCVGIVVFDFDLSCFSDDSLHIGVGNKRWCLSEISLVGEHFELLPIMYTNLEGP